MNIFKTIPFVRILMPFIIGILVALYLPLNLNAFFILIGLTPVLIGLLLINKRLKTKIITKIFIVLADVFLFCSAINCCYNYNIKNSESYFGDIITPKQNYVWVGKILQLPVEKERTCKTQMELLAINKTGQLENAKGILQVYFKKPIDKTLLRPGNLLVLKSKFVELEEPQNPNEFNYKRFMADKNIFHLCFVDSQNVFFTGRNEINSLFALGLKIKRNAIEVFKNSELTNDAANFCTALLTGYDDEITTETINAFAHSGTLHVLSVSGWHTGILYIVLVFFFNLFDKHNRHKGIRIVFLITALFFFTLITGFSAPVLRAAIMLSLLSVGKFYFNYSTNNNLNILAVSAFLILFFDPFLIRDAGFLLSFSAIIGIVFFEPFITESIHIENSFLKRIWQLCSVSISAQISTLPITLALFHQFPLWFIFSNLFIIPLCSIVIYAGILLLLKLKFITGIINGLTSLIFWMVQLTDKPGWGYLDKIDFDLSDAVFLTLIIILTGLFVTRRSYVLGVVSLIILILWQSLSIVESLDKKTTRTINIYAINKDGAFEIKNKDQLLFCSGISGNDYNYHVRPNHSSFNYPCLYRTNINYLKTSGLSFFNYHLVGQESYLNFLQPDYILVSNDCKPKKLPTQTKLLIADGSNSYKNINYLSELCSRSGIKFHSTKQSGYLSINLTSNEIENWR